jgi:hypothetical protein
MEKAVFIPPPQGKEDERFAQLETLRKASWEAIVSRRGVEWKASIALWSILAAFVALIVSSNPVLENCQKALLCLFPLATALIYIVWLLMMFEAYNIDKQEEGDFRKEMGRLAGYTQHERVQKEVKKAIRARLDETNVGHPVANTMHAPQIVMTVVLAVFSCAVVWTVPFPKDVSNQEPKSHRRPAE